MNQTSKRWWILIACCVIDLCLGSVYSWSVFSVPMAQHLSAIQGKTVTAGDLAIVYTIANSVGPITMISGGWFNDRFGPRKVVMVGGAMFGLGMILSGFATGIVKLIVTYGLIGGLGLGMAYGCTISTCVKWFPDKRGMIGGLTTASYGFSSVILPAVVNAVVKHFDVTVAFKAIGLVFLAVVIACAALLESAPEGFSVPGRIPAANAGKDGNDCDWKQMLRTPRFYAMILLLTCGAFSGMMIISQASAVGIQMIGMSMSAAAAAVSVLALFNTFGRIAAGSLSDKLGRINTLMLACVLSCVGLFLLFISGESSLVTFYAGISVVGICFGTFMGVFPGFTADAFGSKNNSVNYGIMFIGFAMAGYFGPTVMKTIYNAAGAYQKAFLAAIGLNAAGLVLAVIYKFLVKKESRK